MAHGGEKVVLELVCALGFRACALLALEEALAFELMLLADVVPLHEEPGDRAGAVG